jgi:hypothetical protein
VETKNICSFQPVFRGSNLFFFTTFPTTFGIFSSGKNNPDSSFQVKKTLDLLNLQIQNDNGTPKYVPVRVRSRENNDENKKENDGIVAGMGLDGKSDFSHIIDFESGRDKEKDTDKTQSNTHTGKTKVDEWGGDVWVSESREMPSVTATHPHNTHNSDHDTHTINVRVCVCLRVKEVEKEVAQMEYSTSVKKIIPTKKINAPSSLSTKEESKEKEREKEKEKDRDKEKEREREREKESSGSKYQCQFNFIDCEIVENCKKPKGTFSFRTYKSTEKKRKENLSCPQFNQFHILLIIDNDNFSFFLFRI